jgi:hypothetical protein
MTDRSPDPVREAREYQEHLLGLVGSDDPAAVQAATGDLLRAVISEAGDGVGKIPAAGEWSVWGCLAHLVDAELAVSGRYRFILTAEKPELLGYDQDLWVDKTHDGEESTDELLTIWEPLRAANLRLWRRSTPTERERVGIHSERGPESYELTFRMIAGHDRFHLGQMQRTLTAIRSAQ